MRKSRFIWNFLASFCDSVFRYLIYTISKFSAHH